MCLRRRGGTKILAPMQRVVVVPSGRLYPLLAPPVEKLVALGTQVPVVYFPVAFNQTTGQFISNEVGDTTPDKFSRPPFYEFNFRL